MSSNTRKSEFLGISYGTASHRLRKQIMLLLLQRLNADVCFKCEGQIETVEELSIEHIEPWYNRENGIELFWSLDNIAFSHLKCNRPHINTKEASRKVGPSGTAWCFECKDFRPTNEFNKHSGRWNGLQNMCKIHKSELNKKRY